MKLPTPLMEPRPSLASASRHNKAIVTPYTRKDNDCVTGNDFGCNRHHACTASTRVCVRKVSANLKGPYDV